MIGAQINLIEKFLFIIMIVNTNICIVLNHGPDTTLSTYINSYNLHINPPRCHYCYLPADEQVRLGEMRLLIHAHTAPDYPN